MKADVIRQKYLDFFKSKKHKIIESDSLVPKDDPTVLFTPAGMNQFKKQFLGMIGDYTRATTSQRCLRTDDLEKVGKTDYHHTLFEMLGNFSFGDYFKQEAIEWAWEFLTLELKINPEKLWVSVYKDDEEAYKIWKDKMKIPVGKLVKLGDKDNFWPADAKEKGPNGPCGPCSEIFFDQGESVGCRKKECSPECSCGRFVEVWNLVFTQFNRKDGGVLEHLPQKNIDTGMGLERIVAVMQHVKSNFQTDLFQPIINNLVVSAKKQNKGCTEDFHAIADHLRAIVFSIYDGILPSNEARGYVVRKLIRKSVLHLRNLGIVEAYMYKLVPVLADVMKNPYPQLLKRKENIADIILSEEKNFIATLNSSSNLLEEKFKEFITGKNDPQTCGVIAFNLYDTHGIPLDITLDWAKKNKIAISKESYDKELNLQKTRSKNLSAMQGDVFSLKEAPVKDVKPTQFLGYDNDLTQAKIIKIIKDGKPLDVLNTGDTAQVVLDKSVFYAESGGQVGDIGVIQAGENIFEVSDTQKLEKVTLHNGVIKNGKLKLGDNVEAKFDQARRLAIARNHTATHLLQAALRTVLGDHVQQQGSMVSQDKLRFDFTHFKEIKKEEIDRIEELVNLSVLANLLVSKRELSLQQARDEGALAFFAEKYEDKVRVVSVDKISKELCGGTHLNFTGSIGLFKIVHEGSVASGVRRIEAITGVNAYKTVKDEEQVLDSVCDLLKIPADKVSFEIEKKIKQIKELEKQVSLQKFVVFQSSVDGWLKEAPDFNGKKIIIKEIKDADIETQKKVADLIKNKESNVVICTGSTVAIDKVVLVVSTNIPGIDASAIVKEISVEIGGSGGGRKDMAQAGGNIVEGLPKALDKFKNIVTKILGS